MAHFLDEYADRVSELLHDTLGGTLCFKQEIIEVPGLLAGLLVTYEGVMDDSRCLSENVSWEEFLARMSVVKPDWRHFDRALMEQLAAKPTTCMGGWERKTIYFIKGGRHPDHWTATIADRDVPALLTTAWHGWGGAIQYEVEHLRELVPVARDHFGAWENTVRVIFNYLFRYELGQGRPQSRTEPENEGVEIPGRQGVPIRDR